MIQIDKKLQTAKEFFVPSTFSEKDFWRIYFYLVFLVRVEHDPNFFFEGLQQKLESSQKFKSHVEAEKQLSDTVLTCFEKFNNSLAKMDLYLKHLTNFLLTTPPQLPPNAEGEMPPVNLYATTEKDDCASPPSPIHDLPKHEEIEATVKECVELKKKASLILSDMSQAYIILRESQLSARDHMLSEKAIAEAKQIPTLPGLPITPTAAASATNPTAALTSAEEKPTSALSSALKKEEEKASTSNDSPKHEASPSKLNEQQQPKLQITPPPLNKASSKSMLQNLPPGATATADGEDMYDEEEIEEIEEIEEVTMAVVKGSIPKSDGISLLARHMAAERAASQEQFLSSSPSTRLKLIQSKVDVEAEETQSIKDGEEQPKVTSESEVAPTSALSAALSAAKPKEEEEVKEVKQGDDKAALEEEERSVKTEVQQDGTITITKKEEEKIIPTETQKLPTKVEEKKEKLTIVVNAKPEENHTRKNVFKNVHSMNEVFKNMMQRFKEYENMRAQFDQKFQESEEEKKKQKALHPTFNPKLLGSKFKDIKSVSTEVQRKKLVRLLPKRLQSRNWSLVYSTREHGTSLGTFLRQNEKKNLPVDTLLIIQTKSGVIFGGFNAEPWKNSQNRFFGTGETFVFSFMRPGNEKLTPEEQTKESKCIVFKWSQKNKFFIRVSNSQIVFGGGDDGKASIILDASFEFGSTHACQTFDSESLNFESEDFGIRHVECWALEEAKQKSAFTFQEEDVEGKEEEDTISFNLME